MKKTTAFLAASLAALSLYASGSPNAAFVPRRVPSAPARADLNVSPSNMPFVQCELNGKPCLMLFDTGNTHTTFDINFIKREFPETKMTQVVDSGNTNVRQNPSIFHVDTLKVGEAEFADFSAMAIDLSSIAHIADGQQLVGVLGMNVIDASRTLISLADSKVVFGLGKDARDGFGQPAKRRNGLYDFTLLLSTNCGNGSFPLIIDSGCTWTFLKSDCGWEATTNEVTFTARSINSAEQKKPVLGEPGTLTLYPHAEIDIKPLLVPEPLNCIGSDTLRDYDILIEPTAVGFRKKWRMKEPGNGTKAE